METKHYDLTEILLAVSGVVDMMEPALADHHRRVAYLSVELGRTMGLSNESLKKLFYSSLVHDLGAFRTSERLSLLNFEEIEPERHSICGARLLNNCSPLHELSPIVLCHHQRWDVITEDDVPLESWIIHLADRVAVALFPSEVDLDRVQAIREKLLSDAGIKFKPEVVDAFIGLAEREAFWFDLAYRMEDESLLLAESENFSSKITLEELFHVAKLFCAVVDFRSPFTATHSCGVAAISSAIAKLDGWSSSQCLEMEIAGLVHDLGKMAVPEEIIEKPDALNIKEWWIMKQHPYHSSRVLSGIKGLEKIQRAAAYHHELWTNRAYPFHVDISDVPIEAHMLAVADVFTALTESRPYRKAGDKKEVLSNLMMFCKNSVISDKVIANVGDNFTELDLIREAAQESALQEYRTLLN